MTAEASSEKKRYDFFAKHRLFIFLWLRELLWKLGQWNSSQLDEFIKNFNPDIFLFPIEDYWYFNRINKYIIKKYKPKRVVSFLWDDNFTYKQHPYSLSARISRFFTRRQVKKLISLSDVVLTICPKMKKECDEEYGINSVIITKPVLSEDSEPRIYDKERPIKIVYSGSLVIGRDKSVAELVKVLSEINKHGTKIFLDIYSRTSLTPNQHALLNVERSSCFKGHLPQNEVFKEQENADVLLFVENIDNKKTNIARLSFSTKITDYLSRNRCILAIGPSDIAPVEYLKNEDAALVCSNRAEITQAIYKIVDDPSLISEYARKAQECALRNHSKVKIQQKFREALLG